MRFRKLNILLFIFLCGPAVYANEKKDEGGAAAEAVTPKDQREFSEKSAKLSTLANRISEAEKHFEELVHHKNESKDVLVKQGIIKEMVTVTEQRNKDVEAYNKLKDEVELRYPNEGEHLNRRYETQSKRSVEELEGVAGLDELLTRTKKIVEKKFAPFNKDEPKLNPKRNAQKKPASGHSESNEEAAPRLRLEK